jgi:hypothetical protein
MTRPSCTSPAADTCPPQTSVTARQLPVGQWHRPPEQPVLPSAARQDEEAPSIQIGGSARDYLPGFAWFGAPLSGPTRERPSVCLFIGALGVNFRICRRPGDVSYPEQVHWHRVMGRLDAAGACPSRNARHGARLLATAANSAFRQADDRCGRVPSERRGSSTARGFVAC